MDSAAGPKQARCSSGCVASMHNRRGKLVVQQPSAEIVVVMTGYEDWAVELVGVGGVAAFGAATSDATWRV